MHADGVGEGAEGGKLKKKKVYKNATKHKMGAHRFSQNPKYPLSK
jgi:hypothetical protein